jgi:hypothetical protein
LRGEEARERRGDVGWKNQTRSSFYMDGKIAGHIQIKAWNYYDY